jgi:hypothetical protein
VIITLVFEKNATFLAENWQKLQKIVIITSTQFLSEHNEIGPLIINHQPVGEKLGHQASTQVKTKKATEINLILHTNYFNQTTAFCDSSPAGA